MPRNGVNWAAFVRRYRYSGGCDFRADAQPVGWRYEDFAAGVESQWALSFAVLALFALSGVACTEGTKGATPRETIC